MESLRAAVAMIGLGDIAGSIELLQHDEAADQRDDNSVAWIRLQMMRH